MEEYSKNGRKLRPRKTRQEGGTQKVYSSTERRESYGSHEHRSYGENREHRSYGDRPERRSFSGNSEHRSYGSSEHRSYGSTEHKSYGNSERRNYGENREQRSFGDRPERRSYSGKSEYRSYGSGEHRNYGSSEHRSYANGERRSFGGNSEHKGYGNRERSFTPRNGQSGGRGRNFSGENRGFKPRKSYMFTKESEAGIERMISRRPQASDNYSDNDMVSIPVKDEIRLNKFIANSGVCSRREADTLIQAGVVTVNGEVVTELGTKVNVFTDDVRFNGERLKGEEKVYIVMNKPKGYVTTASDPHAEKTVIDLLKGCEARVFPVGRLDKATTGVLMFTNDGEIAERLTHPSYDKKKIYQVILDKELKEEDKASILAGITLQDGDVAADELEYIDENDHRKLGIEIHSGKNRIVRRIFESLGYDVRALDRVYFAGLTKKGLKKGEWRYLTEGEVNILKMGAYV